MFKILDQNGAVISQARDLHEYEVWLIGRKFSAETAARAVVQEYHWPMGRPPEANDPDIPVGHPMALQDWLAKYASR